MIPIYLLWLAGILAGLLFVTQIGLLVYKIYKKQEKFAINIILAIVFIFISIACTSTAILIGIKKVADTDISYKETGKTIGETAADITANAYESFKETWDETVPEDKKN